MYEYSPGQVASDSNVHERHPEQWSCATCIKAQLDYLRDAQRSSM